MSEKLNQFCDNLLKKFEGVEAKLLEVEDKLVNSTHDAVQSLKQKHEETKAKIAELKDTANSNIAVLRQELEDERDDAWFEMQTKLDKLEEDIENKIIEADNAWNNAVADLTGGTIF